MGLEKLKASCLFRGIPHGRRHSGVLLSDVSTQMGKEVKSFVSLESNWIVVNRSQLCCVGVLNYRYTLFLTTRTSFCQLPWMD